VGLAVELGVPYTGWPVRLGNDYDFAIDIVSEDLREEILDWARDFNLQFDEVDGWMSAEAAAAHKRRGQELKEKLQGQLGSGYSVTLRSIESPGL